MTEMFIVVGIALAVLAYVGWRLIRSNMEIPPSAERRLPARDALRFAVEHGLPIKADPVGALNDSRNPNVNRGW